MVRVERKEVYMGLRREREEREDERTAARQSIKVR